MQQPWDRPELVREGDADPKQIYMSVGRVLSQWEGVEIQLGYIYTAATGRHGDWYALLEYGEGNTTARRLRVVHEAVDVFFARRPNQDAEATAACLLESAGFFAARRHDIAHGVVRDHTWASWRIPPDRRDPTGFFLLPSHYRGRAFNEEALPVYAYTVASMEVLRHQLVLMETEAMGVAELLRRHAGG